MNEEQAKQPEQTSKTNKHNKQHDPCNSHEIDGVGPSVLAKHISHHIADVLVSRILSNMFLWSFVIKSREVKLSILAEGGVRILLHIRDPKNLIQMNALLGWDAWHGEWINFGLLMFAHASPG